MVRELDWPAKEKLGVEGDQPVTYTYLLMFIHMIFSKDQMKIYFLNFLYLLLMQL